MALSQDERVLVSKELNDGYSHAENLHVFIEAVLRESGVRIEQLSAIGVSKGPGSYTGLRIGVSAAKGLAYALRIPLISVSTLEVMTAMATERKPESGVYCGMIDARRMEVYTATYDAHLNALSKTEALVLNEESIQKYADYSKIYFFGDGMPKSKSLLASLANAHFVEEIYPSARYMAALVYHKFQKSEFEDLAYFEPFYLKDFMVMQKKPRS